MDIWERFRQEAVSPVHPQSTLIVVGDAQAGKSTIISKFIEQNVSTKATVALEYLYARKGIAFGNQIY